MNVVKTETGHSLGHSRVLFPCKLQIILNTCKDSQSSNPGSIPGSATNSRHANRKSNDGIPRVLAVETAGAVLAPPSHMRRIAQG